MAEDAVESAGAKAPAFTFLINDSPRAMENILKEVITNLANGAGNPACV
jgi:hypothetical protein